MMKYYKLNAATTPAMLLPLALPIVVDGRLVLHPTPAQAAQHGAYPCSADDAPPTPPAGKDAVPDGWEVRDGAWVRTWRYEDAPEVVPADVYIRNPVTGLYHKLTTTVNEYGDLTPAVVPEGIQR